jgi:hypothetical protein
MKKFLAVCGFACLLNTLHGQELSQVSFSGGSTLVYFSLLTDREVLIRISENGQVLEWGVEIQSFRSSNYYARQLQPYAGRVDYYGADADSVSNGKVRSIGSSVITYYSATEAAYKVGKIRTVGSLLVDYFSNFDNKLQQGMIRFIGSLALDYYTTFDNDAYSGKLRSVGSTLITYYSSFDDKLIRGKLKSIGPLSYAWYSSLETRYGGGLKSGSFRQNVGSVVYIIQ